MFIVLFEVEPHQDRFDDYLETAKVLRPELEAIEGFIDNTRYTSARTPGRILSLSTWRDEKSLIRWRTQATHHEHGQRRGRFEIFADYRLRVAEVTHDTNPPAGAELRQHRYDETEVGTAKAASVIEPLDPARADALPEMHAAPGPAAVERFDGVLEPHAPLLLASWAGVADARNGVQDSPGFRVRHARVIREYGMRERREAPQYLPEVEPDS